MKKRILVNQWLDRYGLLLTAKQQKVMELYYGQDLSLAEISEALNISRTAISETLKTSIHKMAILEEKLQLIKKEKAFITLIKTLELPKEVEQKILQNMVGLLKKKI